MNTFNLDKRKQDSVIKEIKEGLLLLYPSSIKSIELEKEEDEETFLFEIEFYDEITSLNIPDGVIITYISFREKFFEGFLDAGSFLQFVKEK